MRYKNLFTLSLAVLILCPLCADNEEEKALVNAIKKDECYLYADVTAGTSDEARLLSEKKLVAEINVYSEGRNDAQDVTALIEVWTEILMPRGNMFRSFVYIKKSDVVPEAETKEDVEMSLPEAPESVMSTAPDIVVSVGEAPLSSDIPEVVENLAECSTFSEAEKLLSRLKAEGKVMEYDRYAKLENPDNYWLLIYDRSYNVVAVLTPGTERLNISTRQSDDTTNYPGHGAIGFTLKK